MQTTAIRTVANSLPQNEVILLTLLISKRYIPNTDLRKKNGETANSIQKVEFTTQLAQNAIIKQIFPYIILSIFNI